MRNNIEGEPIKEDYYYAHISGRNQAKNKLQEVVRNLVETYGNKIYAGSEITEVKKQIIDKINELNKQYPRCTPLNPSFDLYDNTFNLWGLDFIFLHLYRCTMYKS